MGFSTNDFYCCGKLKSSAIELTPSTKQTCSNRYEKKGCCESKLHFFKVKDNHLSGKDINIPDYNFINLNLFASATQQICFTSQLNVVINGSHSPPLYPGVPVYISNCIFII